MAAKPRRIVLFLGAGASAPFGYPTTERILPDILSALSLGRRSAKRPAWLVRVEKRSPELRRELLEGLSLLLPGTADSPLHGSASIIDVLSSLDYLIASKQSLAPTFDEPRLRAMRRHLDHCVYGVLRGSKNAHIRTALVKWIVDKTSHGNRVAIITTNYDCMLDLPLFTALMKKKERLFHQVDFGTTVLNHRSQEFNRPADARVAVFKLHGSLNALRCEVCGHLYVNPSSRITSLEFRKVKDEYNSCICDGRLRSILVAPSLVRDVREPHLLSIWNAALNELRLAHEWNFVGYSLPQEDIAIRTMLLRAYHGRTRQRLGVRLALWDPAEQRARKSTHGNPLPAPADPNDLVKEQLAQNALKRYRDFIPAKHFAVNARQYFPDGVEGFVNALA